MFIMEAGSRQWEHIWLGALCSGASLTSAVGRPIWRGGYGCWVSEGIKPSPGCRGITNPEGRFWES